MGWDPVPLAPEGRRQIEELAERVRGQRVDRMIASDIRRTVESAEILSEALGLPFETQPALREVNVGEAKGLSYSEVVRRWPGLLEPAGEVRFPGGESFADVADRAARYLRSIVHETPERILVVTHGGVVIGATARLLGRPLADLETFGVDNASLSVIRFEKGRMELVLWNDTGHLAPREAAEAHSATEAQAPLPSWARRGG